MHSERPGAIDRMRASTLGLGLGFVVVLVASLVGCSSDGRRSLGVPSTVSRRAAATTTTTTTTTAAGGTATDRRVVIDGLDGPTQFVDGPGNTLLIAELGGDEDGAQGRVTQVDLGTGKRTVLLSGLDKPTGLAWWEGRLWVMQRRSLESAPWTGTGHPGPLRTEVGDLPFNGRSEGTLTIAPDHRVIYETTGTLDGNTAQRGSGTLWAFDPETRRSSQVAIGLKNAYAHAFLPDGTLLTTDIGDNITERPVEELDALPYPRSPKGPTDAGWPRCPGDRTCPGVVTPLVTFQPSSTPTGVSAKGGSAYVALFVSGDVVRVPLAGSDHTPVVVLTDLEGPHTIMWRPDGTLWVSEVLGGRIIATTPG